MAKAFPSSVFFFACVFLAHPPLAQAGQTRHNVSEVVKATVDSTAAFTRCELKKSGDKWIGKSVSNLPHAFGTGEKWCRLETDIEIDKISDSRIEGVALGWTSMNVGKCQPERPERKQFIWIPK